MKVPKIAEEVFDIFEGHELYLVGGSVRDPLLGRETNDLDFATKLKPEETKAVLTSKGYKTHDVGWAFGTVAFFHNDLDIHVTTYRRDEDYQLDSRKPRVEWGTCIEDDLKRRDFTINALAMDRKGNVVDLFGGLKDLKERVLRTPIESDKAFTDDPLRMLRALRFKAKLGFEYSEELKKSLKKNAEKVLTLSKERVLEETCKILESENCVGALDGLREYELLKYVFPEMVAMVDMQQGKYHHKDVWRHTLLTVGNVKRDIVLRWTMFFHDIGKPKTFTCEDGEIHFYKHEEESSTLAEDIMRRMGFPKNWIKQIKFLIEQHMKPSLYESKWTKSAVRRFVNKMGNNLENILEVSRADITSSNPEKIKRRLSFWNELCERCKEVIEYTETKCPVNGHELMKRFKIEPGPQIKQMKQLVMEAILEGILPLEHEDKNIYFDHIAANLNPPV